MGIAAIAQGSRITSQRHCYNLCENRLGLAALIVAARGYACRAERPGRKGDQPLRRFDLMCTGNEGKAVGFP